MGCSVSVQTPNQPVFVLPAAPSAPSVGFKYVVSVVTGAQRRAGTAAKVTGRLLGTKGASHKFDLAESPIGVFAAGNTSTVEITHSDLGDIWMLEVRKSDDGLDSDWFLNTVEVYCPDTKLTFACPAFRWMTRLEELRFGPASLPQGDASDAARRDQRTNELERRRAGFPLSRQPGIPVSLGCGFDDLPADELWNDDKRHDFMDARQTVINEFLVGKFLGNTDKFERFSDYAEFDNVLPFVEVAARFRSDAAFGRARLHGSFLVSIEGVVDSLPEKFAVDPARLQPLLRSETTLQDELTAGRFYFTDCQILDGLATDPGRYTAPAMVLYYVNAREEFVPVAIQLQQRPGPDNPVFYADDNEHDWLAAKMFAANADLQRFQVVEHLLRTHLVTEPIVLATLRQLPCCHPVYKLLKPHFKFQLGVNSLARSQLLPEGGIIDQVFSLSHKAVGELLSRAYGEWRWEHEAPQANLDRRRLSQRAPPSYHYATDSVRLWQALRTFVGDLLGPSYASHDDIAADSELQAWLSEIVTGGFGDHGFPRQFDSPSHLFDTLATFIWIESGQHAVLNFAQYQTMAFAPFASAGLYGPPPTVKGQRTETDNLQLLPSPKAALAHLATVYVLSQYSGQDSFLGSYPELLFVEPHAVAAVQRFSDTMKALEADMKSSHPDWLHLAPSRVPNSTAV